MVEVECASGKLGVDDNAFAVALADNGDVRCDLGIGTNVHARLHMYLHTAKHRRPLA